MSSLLERLAKLKEAKPAGLSKAAEVIEKVEAKALETKEEKKEEKKVEETAQDVKTIISNITALEASEDMKALEGFNWQNFQDSLLAINNKMETAFPEINTALTSINKNLRAFPELAHLLNHEQIAVIVQRILIQKEVWIAPQKKEKAKKEKVTPKGLADLVGELDADDL